MAIDFTKPNQQDTIAVTQQPGTDMVVKEYDIACLLYTSDAADEEDSVDLGGRRINKKKKEHKEQ